MDLTEWETKLKDIIILYTGNRKPDPFMKWFKQKDSEGFFAGDFERVLTILIDARFDQKTTAEKALEYTQAVVQMGVLKSLVARSELPLLVPREKMTAEKWTALFCSSLSSLHELAKRIVDQGEWDAAELLRLMKYEFKVPYLGVKTSRLAVRWLHELVPRIKIDMFTYSIPVDSLVYRVCCRLGVIDPNSDKYHGEGSPADVKIQAFVRRIWPEKSWLLDEPFWSAGRRPERGGHCFPQNPNCHGCLFESICPRKLLDTDPVKLGMEAPNTRKWLTPVAFQKKPVITQRQTEFAKFVEGLEQKGIRGEEWREKVKQWQREHGSE